MTVIWNTLLKTLAATKIVYFFPDGRGIVMPEGLKPYVAGQGAIESSHGMSPLVVGNDKFPPPYNFWSLKKRDFLVPFPVGSVSYDGGDGVYEYCSFRNVLEAIDGYWAFMVSRGAYPNIEKYLTLGQGYFDCTGKIFCPPGYTTKWKVDHGNRDYTDLIVNVLAPEAAIALKAVGWKQEEIFIPAPLPIPIPAPNPGLLSITAGILSGPNVKYWWVKNHDSFQRPVTIGIVFHEPDAHSAGTEAQGLGIVYDWSIAATQKSAHVLILEDGTILQTVDFTKPAWHCGAENMRRLGFEVANIGPFWPWQEILGWFFRFRNKPWEQKIRKSDMQLINGMYWSPYTDAQIASAKALVAVCENYFGHSLSVDGHNKFNTQRVDPGPLWWDKYNR